MEGRSERRKKFVDEYILTGSATEAARRAGYAEKYCNRQGHYLLKNAEVRRQIDERLAQIDSEKILEQKQLLEYLSSVVKGEEADEMLVTRLVGKGMQVVERYEVRSPTKERIRAAELLLKIQGAGQEPAHDMSNLFVATLEAIWNKSLAEGES